METDLYLLWLILLTTVAVKVLRAPVAAACNMVRECVCVCVCVCVCLCVR